MRKGDNQGEDRQPVTPEEKKINNSEKILEEIQSLRNTVETLKKGIAEPEPVSTNVTQTPAQPESSGAQAPAEASVQAKPSVVQTPAQPEPSVAQTSAQVGVEPGKAPAQTVVEPAQPRVQPEPSVVQTPVQAGVESAQTHAQPEARPVQAVAVAEPAQDKVIKTIVEEERVTAKDNTSGSSDFASKYRDHMKRQVAEADAKKKRQAEKLERRETARREKDRLKAERAEQRAEHKRRKREEDEARKREKKARAKELQQQREIRAEVRRKKRIANRTAKYGGGVVQFHGTEISTEVQPVAKYSLKELLGFAHRDKIKLAETEEEKKTLQKEQEMIAEDARQAAAHLSKVRASKFQNSAPGRIIYAIRSYSERHKKILLSTLGVVLLIVVGTAGFINYYTLYEYSYNGHPLGYVKDKNDVLKITDMVQKALTTDKDIQVVIDDKDDIEFKRVSTLDSSREGVQADTSDQVLKRLTYMGDLNVKAWGIYVDGRKVGSVQKKAYAADVLKMLEERYSSGKEGAKIEKAEVQEDIQVKKSNTDLRNVLSSEEMTEKLCTNDDREIVHTIVADETLKDIAEEYKVTEEDLLFDNENIDPNKLVVGDTILIKKNAPPVTVRITEKRTYEQKIKYKTEKKKTDEMYEGEVEIKQEGKNGRERITERTVSINGDIDDKDIEILDRTILRKAVKKIMIVGTAERPPSVGDGKYIWPMEPGYSLSSHFGYRWGRMHSGIDLAGSVGHDIYAADGGIVTRAGYFGGYGLCIDVDHQNGQSTRYAHLSQTLVSPGDEVYEGMVIAKSGNTGNSTGPHLHFEIHIGGSAVDPLAYLP